MRVRFEQHHSRSSPTGEQRNHKSDWPAANDGDSFVRANGCESHIVNRDRERFDHRRVIVRNGIWNGVQTIRRDGPEFLKRAIGIDSEKAQIFTDVIEAASARAAVAAGNRGFNDNTITGLKAGAFSARNHRNHFVPQNSSGSGALGHSALKDQQIGSANSDAADLKQNFSVRGLRNWLLGYFQAAGPTVDRGFHGRNTRLPTLRSPFQIARCVAKKSPVRGIAPMQVFH
jgi:hypothetical protein